MCLSKKNTEEKQNHANDTLYSYRKTFLESVKRREIRRKEISIGCYFSYDTSNHNFTRKPVQRKQAKRILRLHTPKLPGEERTKEDLDKWRYRFK
jgi:hypothetical protein